MMQRIAHAAMLNVATPDEVAEIIAKALSGQRDHDYHREPGAVTLDTNGSGQATVILQRQYDWICERVTLTSGPNALIQFYLNQVQNSDMLEVVQLGTAGLYSDSFANNLFVPAGSRLLIVCTGGGANGQMTYNLQVRLVKTQ